MSSSGPQSYEDIFRSIARVWVVACAEEEHIREAQSKDFSMTLSVATDFTQNPAQSYFVSTTLRADTRESFIVAIPIDDATKTTLYPFRTGANVQTENDFGLGQPFSAISRIGATEPDLGQELAQALVLESTQMGDDATPAFLIARAKASTSSQGELATQSGADQESSDPIATDAAKPA
jgi:hypothetical protein